MSMGGLSAASCTMSDRDRISDDENVNILALIEHASSKSCTQENLPKC